MKKKNTNKKKESKVLVELIGLECSGSCRGGALSL